jgi:hypothetical protein
MLTPILITNDQLDNIIQIQSDEPKPSKTYLMDFETGDIISQFIDGQDAILQAVMKAIMTTRQRYMIYTTDYGCEIKELIGGPRTYSLEYLQMEVPRLINDALSVDDRVYGTKNYDISVDGGTLYITF